MGTVFKRGRYWHVQFYYRKRQIRRSYRDKSRAAALRRLRVMEGDIARNRDIGIYFNSLPFSDMADLILQHYRENGRKSIETLKISLRRLREHFDGMSSNEITTHEIRLYIMMRRSAGMLNGTINRELAALRRMFKLAKQDGLISQIPHIPRQAGSVNRRSGFFEHGEFLALRDGLPDYLKGLVTFAYKTGWRKSEILNLTWDHIDRGAGVVRLGTGETKSGYSRTLSLDVELREVIRQAFVERNIGCPYVFQRGGKRIRDFRTAWDKACREAGIGHRLFHDFRRTAVRNLIRSGVSETVAMKITGHKTRSVFDNYNITSTDDIELAAHLQEEYLQNK